MTDKPKLTTAQVAALLSISTERVRQYARAGRLTFDDTPLGRLFHQDDKLTALLDARRRRMKGE